MVIVGAGFGGLMAARGLARAPVDVLVIDRHNYHLFQPLLYQVATAALSPADIAEPIRVVLRRQRNATVLLDEVIGVDPAAQVVKTRSGARWRYDWLILATGSRYTYFGHADWPSRAPGLKSLDDATLIRRRALLAFEEAEARPTRRCASAVDLRLGRGRPDRGRNGRCDGRTCSRHAVARLPQHQPADRAHHIWSRRDRAYWPGFRKSFPPSPSFARRMGVEVLLDTPIEAIDDHGVTAKGGRIEAANIIWARAWRPRRSRYGSACPPQKVAG